MDLQPVLAEIERHLPSGETRGSVIDSRRDHRKLPYPDPPLVVKPAPLTEEDISLALRELLPGWEVVKGPLPENPDQRRIELHRTFTFRKFQDVLVFMAEVGDFADKANYHPRWENIYTTLRVYLTTWDIGHRISHLDIQLGQYFDRAYKRYQELSSERKGLSCDLPGSALDFYQRRLQTDLRAAANLPAHRHVSAFTYLER